MIFHFHGVEVVKGEFGDSIDGDGELSAEIGLLGFEVNPLVERCRGENIVADTDIVNEDALELRRVGAQYFILLERLEMIGRIARVHAQGVRLHAWQGGLRLFQSRAGGRAWLRGGKRLLDRRALAVDEVNGIRVNNSVVLAANLKVVCDQIYRAFGHHGMGAALRSVAEDAAASGLHPRGLASPAGGV